MRRLAASIVAASLSAQAAEAAPFHWTIDPSASRLDFVYLINGSARRGVFSGFAGEARFDPDALEGAELTFTVDVESVDTGETFGTAIVKTNDWLSAYDYPEARYVLTRLSPAGDGRYTAEGVLTMKERALPVSGDFAVSFPSDAAHAVGQVSFDRSAFNIGVGFTALFVTVGDKITVEFDLVARPKE